MPVMPAIGTAAPALQPLTPMFQTIASMLQPVALPLPDLPSVRPASLLQPLAVPLPAPAPPLHPVALPLQSVALPLQPVAATLETPALLPVMTSVAGTGTGGILLGRERVGWIDLSGQWRCGESQRRGQCKRVIASEHQFLPAARPRGSNGECIVARTGRRRGGRRDVKPPGRDD